METSPSLVVTTSQITSTTASTSTSVTTTIKNEPSSSGSPAPTLTPNPETKPKALKIWTKEELIGSLMPVFDKVQSTEPEAVPFREPVNPDILGIPDYFQIVKTPMDLSSIKKKLEEGKYKDPWGFCDDMRLMFDNAWLYNKKTTKVYKYCTKLYDIFEAEINSIMKSLGYCCGRKYLFNPQVLYCCGQNLCSIPRDVTYYSYMNSHHYCERCYKEFEGDTISLGDDALLGKTNTVKKSEFKKLKNDHLDLEPFVECTECGRTMHQVCVLHLDFVWEDGFVCNFCREAKMMGERKENRFNAGRLPQTKLGAHIEKRVNGFLKTAEKSEVAGYVHIRIVSSQNKAVDVRSGMRERYSTDKFPEKFPYRARALFAFEEIDGVDVCFFGMHTQEFGSDCPGPNRNRIYLSYFDSVHFFKPRHLQTNVYYEILIGYFEFCKNRGFHWAHIWSCPPSEGDDYVFHCHPPEQKIPEHKRLVEWYKKMLDKAQTDKVIVEYKDIYTQALHDESKSPTNLPYFEGDFWPNQIEESIRDINVEEEERKKTEAMQAAQMEADNNEESQSDDMVVTSTGKRKKGNNKRGIKNKLETPAKKKVANTWGSCELSQRIFTIMEKYKEVFFVIRFYPVGEEPTSKIEDPDPLMQSDITDGRDAFLTQSRDRHWEFASLRRAKFSTMAMLVELHNQGSDRFVYNCNICNRQVITRYHCTVCEDCDLCVACYTDKGHEHKMEKLGLDIEADSTPNPSKTTTVNAQEARRKSIERCIQSLEHATYCSDKQCQLQACIKMKKVVSHAKGCKRKNSHGCPICKQLIALCCYHAKSCKTQSCLVPYCQHIKGRLKQQQLQQELRQRQILCRRILQCLC